MIICTKVWDEMPTGRLGTTVLDTPHATFTSGGDNFFNTRGEGLCAYNADYTCSADTTVDFKTEVSGLSFQAFGYDPGDFVLAQAFNSVGTLLDSFDVAGNGIFSFGALAGITRLVLADSSFTGAGFSFTNYEFTEGVAPIPLPAGLPLMLGGLAVAAAFLRKRTSA